VGRGRIEEWTVRLSWQEFFVCRVVVHFNLSPGCPFREERFTKSRALSFSLQDRRRQSSAHFFCFTTVSGTLFKISLLGGEPPLGCLCIIPSGDPPCTASKGIPSFDPGWENGHGSPSVVHLSETSPRLPAMTVRFKRANGERSFCHDLSSVRCAGAAGPAVRNHLHGPSVHVRGCTGYEP
jgi:hypothetical protein